MSYASQWILHNNQFFRGQVAMALLAAARAQVAATTGTNLERRKSLASSVIQNPMSVVPLFMMFVVSHPTLEDIQQADTISDTMLDAVIADVFEAVAVL